MPSMGNIFWTLCLTITTSLPFEGALGLSRLDDCQGAVALFGNSLPRISEQPPCHLRKVQRVAAIAAIKGARRDSEMFQSETGCFDMKQFGE
jgi:hypothetical protein